MPRVAEGFLAREDVGAESPGSLSWSRLYRFRREAAARFGGIFDLPLARRASDELLAAVANGESVLEVGAGDRRMGAILARHRPGVRYESLDPDPEGQHEFRHRAEVTGRYDCVAAFEVVEHLGIEAIPDWLCGLAGLLRPGGRLVLSTPNTYYPPAYLRDATHRTALCCDELAGLVAAAGLEVTRIVRVYNDPIHRRLLRRYAFAWLFRLLGIDYAKQIVVVARRR